MILDEDFHMETFVHISYYLLDTMFPAEEGGKDESMLAAAQQQPLQGPRAASRCQLGLVFFLLLPVFLRSVFEGQGWNKCVSQWSTTLDIKISHKRHKSAVPEGCRPGYFALSVGLISSNPAASLLLT